MKATRPPLQLLAVATLLALLLGAENEARAQLDFPPPVSAEVPLPPAPIAAMGHRYLCYELHVTNYAPLDLRMQQVDVYLDDQTTPLASYAGETLTTALLQPGAPAGVEAGVIRAGGFEVVYLWLELDDMVQPKSLRHVIVLEATGDQPISGSIESRVAVAPPGAVAELGPPLRGGPWVMAHGPGNANGHRRILLPIAGRAGVPQRYAIDYFKVGEDSKIYSGDEQVRENHHAYGEEVLAVADGVIAAAVDGIPENTPSPYERAVPINLETVAGNHVLLDLGDGRYGFYGHFATGSLRVKTGDRVKKGQVIGLLGNTGNTPAPHLHFTVADNTGILANEGLPYSFDSFAVVGECDGTLETWGWFETCDFTEPDPRSNEIPLTWKLVQFPE